MKNKKIPEYRPISVPSTIDEKAENLLHPQDLKRLKALRASYWASMQLQSTLKPLTEGQIDHMMAYCSCGFTKDESLAELGLTRAQWDLQVETFPAMQKLSEVVDQLLKAYCDRMLQACIKDPKIQLQPIKMKLNECRLHDTSIINLKEFTAMTLEEKSSHIMHCLASGFITAKQSHQLLDVLTRVQELVSVPALEAQVDTLRAQLD